MLVKTALFNYNKKMINKLIQMNKHKLDNNHNNNYNNRNKFNNNKLIKVKQYKRYNKLHLMI